MPRLPSGQTLLAVGLTAATLAAVPVFDGIRALALAQPGKPAPAAPAKPAAVLRLLAAAPQGRSLGSDLQIGTRFGRNG